MSQDEKKIKLYPIQATHIGTRELYIKAHRPPSNAPVTEEADYDILVGHSDYNAEEKIIQIAAKIEVGKPDDIEGEGAEGKEEEDLPFHLRIEIVGIFKVNDDVFPAERIYEWASGNAMFILFPFLREQVFALTARAGFNPMLLPLVEVPTFRVAKEDQKAVTE